MMNFEQDFIMRQIQQLTQLLQQIIFKKKQNKHKEARQQIRDALERFTADQPKSFSELSLEETLCLFNQEGRFRAELAVAVADLLAEQGDLYQERKFSQSQKSYAQALLLYQASAREGLQSMPISFIRDIEKVESQIHNSNQLDKIAELVAKV